MGSFTPSKTPQYYSYSETQRLTAKLNNQLKQNAKRLGLLLQFDCQKLAYNDMNWSKSLVSGQLVYQSSLLSSQGKKKQNIVMNLEDLYYLQDTMMHLYKQNNRETSLTSSLTPSIVSDDKLCCICFQNLPSMALPCSHSFCDLCIIKYIVDKQEKKCPKCRREFKGSRSSVQKTIYLVIDEEKEVWQSARGLIISLLEKNNQKIRQINLKSIIV